MSEGTIEGNAQEREKLLPVATVIFGSYIAVMVLSYLIGNLIYQIP